MAKAGRESGQKAQMEDVSMVGTLRAQAEMIWPLEKPLLDRFGFDMFRRVADLGCGTGQFAGRLAAEWPLVTVSALDVFAGHLEEARREFSRSELPNLEFVQGDARDTGWESDRFDAVTIRHVLHALPEVEAVLAESRRILRPGGLLYILAEDYAGLIFDTPGESAQRLFYDATPALAPHGTNLFHGRAAFRELREAGYEDVTIEPIVVDTSNTSREVFGRMLRFWRDGYAAFIAEAGGYEPGDIVARFDSIRETVLDPDRYGCWLLFAVAGRKPAST